MFLCFLNAILRTLLFESSVLTLLPRFRPRHLLLPNILRSPNLPRTLEQALHLASLTVEAGFPPGIIQVISGRGDTGRFLAEHMDIRKISFTGSTRTGRLSEFRMRVIEAVGG